jgi:transcriptional regulator with XRE-family HTH domain
MDLAALRSRLGLSQADFAQLLGVTQPAVVAWEAGKRKPTGRVVVVLDRVERCFTGRTRNYGEHRGRLLELPDERWKVVVVPDREVTLPNRIDWSPRASNRDLRDLDQRAGAYAQVLDEGAPADIRFWIDPDELVALWPDVPVARHMREPVGEMVAALAG